MNKSLTFINPESLGRPRGYANGVLAPSGGAPEQIARLVVYVTDKEEYRARQSEIGACWRRHMGRHFPAMAL
ncbi:MAG TPA: hypothetical protein VGB61_08920, partial [Pyrinomonadaceae bacterium]